MIQANQNKVVYDYLPNGSQTFSFPYKFFAPEEISCFILNGTNEEQLQRNTDFAVEEKGDYSNGANISIAKSDLPQCKLCIIRTLAIEQLTNFPEEGKFPAEILEATFDRFTMICQQLQEQSDRSIKWSGAYNGDALPPEELLIGAVGAARNCLEILESLRALAGNVNTRFNEMKRLIEEELAKLLADAQNKIEQSAADFAATVAVLSRNLTITLPLPGYSLIGNDGAPDLTALQEWQWNEELAGLPRLDGEKAGYIYGMRIEGEDYYYSNNYVQQYHQILLDKIPKNLGGHRLIINFAGPYSGDIFSSGDGTETRTEDHLIAGADSLRISGFFNGSVLISGELLSPGASGALRIENCHASVEVGGTFRSTGAALCNVCCIDTPAVHFSSCTFADTQITGGAIQLINSNATTVDYDEYENDNSSYDENTFACSNKYMIGDIRDDYFEKK